MWRGLLLTINQTSRQSITCWRKFSWGCAHGPRKILGLSGRWEIIPKVSWVSEHVSDVEYFRTFSGERRWWLKGCKIGPIRISWKTWDYLASRRGDWKKNDLITDLEIMRLIKLCMVASCFVSGEVGERKAGHLTGAWGMWVRLKGERIGWGSIAGQNGFPEIEGDSSDPVLLSKPLCA